MKPVFKCDYCDFMGTEQDVKKHEVECPENFTRRSCYTCQHVGFKSLGYVCGAGKEIPDGKIFEFCPKYVRKEKNDENDLFGLVSGLFRGK